MVVVCCRGGGGGGGSTMASIRRSLSPSPSPLPSPPLYPSNGHDRLLPQIQILRSSSLSPHYCPSSPFRRFLIWVMGLLLFFHDPSPLSSRKAWAAHHHRHHNHHHHLWHWNWKRSFLRFLLFFLLGFLLGFSPFAHLHDLKPHHFFFDSIASSTPAAIDNNIVTITINNPHPHPHTNLVLVRPTKMMMETEIIKPVVELQKSNNKIYNPTEKGKRKEKEKENEINPTSTGDPSVVPPPELNLKLLIVVTPTYNRALQAYYLNRLGQTLRLVPPPLLWIVVEMKSAASMETADILRRTGVAYRHLVCDDSNNKNSNIKDRGVHQRNTALDHIQRHSLDAIVYFADDDNIYSLNLFHQLRNIRRFGTWPVAMLVQSKNKATLEGPVCNGSQVIGWHTNEKSKRVRRFHVDMSGFAFNSTILWDPKKWQHPTSHAIRQLDTVKEGFQETTFIEQVVEDESQMEGIPHGCSKIMNWHLHLEVGHLSYPKGWQVSRNLDVVSSLG